MHYDHSCLICILHRSIVLTDKKTARVHPCSRMQAFGPLHLSRISASGMGCFELVTFNSLAKHGPACTCHALLSIPNITEVPNRIITVSDSQGRALAWHLISFYPQSCHFLLQLIPANSPPAHVSMSVFPTAFFRALQHLADFVCLLGMHPCLNMHCMPQDDNAVKYAVHNIVHSVEYSYRRDI